MDRRLFALQRLSALLLAPLVLVHLGLILYVSKGGLTAADILGRTRGSIGWMLFYGLFVLAVSVHVPIGLRNVLIEWLRMSRKAASVAAVVFGLALLVLGARAVFAVTGVR